MDFDLKRVGLVEKQTTSLKIKNPRKFLTHRDFERVPGGTRTVVLIFNNSAKQL